MKILSCGMIMAALLSGSAVAHTEKAEMKSDWELADPGEHFLKFSVSPSMTGKRKEVYVHDMGDGNYQFTQYIRARKAPKTVNVIQSKDCKYGFEYLKQLPQIASQQGYLPGISNVLPQSITLDGVVYGMEFKGSINPSGRMQETNVPLIIYSRGGDVLSSWIGKMNGALETCAGS